MVVQDAATIVFAHVATAAATCGVVGNDAVFDIRSRIAAAKHAAAAVEVVVAIAIQTAGSPAAGQGKAADVGAGRTYRGISFRGC